MAAAVSTPELFINCVGTFVTKGDIGESTVVGSAIFNMLAVPACCGLFLGNSLKLDWWPITRDCLSYTMVVLTLLGIVVDGRIMWYESLCLVIGYFVYMLGKLSETFQGTYFPFHSCSYFGDKRANSL